MSHPFVMMIIIIIITLSCSRCLLLCIRSRFQHTNYKNSIFNAIWCVFPILLCFLFCSHRTRNADSNAKDHASLSHLRYYYSLCFSPFVSCSVSMPAKDPFKCFCRHIMMIIVHDDWCLKIWSSTIILRQHKWRFDTYFCVFLNVLHEIDSHTEENKDNRKVQETRQGQRGCLQRKVQQNISMESSKF